MTVPLPPRGSRDWYSWVEWVQQVILLGGAPEVTDAGVAALVADDASDTGQAMRAVSDARYAGRELDYAEATASQSTSVAWSATVSSGVALTGLSIDVTAGTRPFYVETQVLAQNNSAGAGSVLQIFDDTGLEIARVYAHSAAANSAVLLRARRRISLPAGTARTYHARIGALGGTVNVTATPTSPIFLHAVEC